MSILKYKYKAHKLVNTLFYVIIFGVGFLLGFSTEKINFNKLINQVLMIDNVSALSFEEMTWDSKIDYGPYTIHSKNLSYSSISVKPSSSTYYNEEYIYSLFNEVVEDLFLDISFADYSNVYTIFYNSGVWNDYYFYFSLSDYTGSPSKLYSSGRDVFSIRISKYLSSITLTYSSCDDGAENCSIMLYNGSHSGTSQMASTSTNITGLGHYMDFSEYTIKVEFNENLFKDNPDFKEVCVNNYDKFGIVSNNYSTIETENVENNYRVFSDRDFIWFPNGVKGISTFLYHNKSENNTKLIEQDGAFSLYGYWFWLNSKEEIDNYFSSDDSIVSYMLNEKGYTDKYSYYNYTMHPFINYFNGLDEEYLFNVFWFKEFGINHIDDDNIEYPDKYCFYVRNEYDVLIFKTNEWGDLYVDTTILGDKDLHFSTSENESSVNNVGLFSVVNNFIHQIKSTIEFINMNIYNLYLSMPLIVRMFLLAVFTILIIKFLIDMIVR